jgi:hypothetical protein
MKMLVRGWPLLAGLVVLCLLIAGCKRDNRVTVNGTVMRNGKPLAMSPTGILQVTLMPDVPEDQPYTSKIGECDKSGNFTITEVTPGKYKIGVEQFDPNPQTDKLNSAFRADTGKIKREIDGKAPLTIDLAKPAGG